MNFAPYLNKNFRQQKLSSVILEYDKDKNGAYTKEEIMHMVKKAKSPLGGFLSIFVPTSTMVKEIFIATDFNQDKIITLEEFDSYLKKEFNIELQYIQNKSIEEICIEIDNKT